MHFGRHFLFIFRNRLPSGVATAYQNLLLLRCHQIALGQSASTTDHVLQELRLDSIRTSDSKPPTLTGRSPTLRLFPSLVPTTSRFPIPGLEIRWSASVPLLSTAVDLRRNGQHRYSFWILPLARPISAVPGVRFSRAVLPTV